MFTFSLSIFLSRLSLVYKYVRRIHSIRIHLLSLLCVVHLDLYVLSYHFIISLVVFFLTEDCYLNFHRNFEQYKSRVYSSTTSNERLADLQCLYLFDMYYIMIFIFPYILYTEKKKVSHFATNSKPFLGFVLSCETITTTFQASRNLFQRFRICARNS
jgi:hypothetical protein